MNYENLGSILKKVRTSKGYSQKYISENILSQSNYSRYESGSIDISSSVFFSLLDRIEVSFEEYLLYYRKERKLTKHDIISSFYNLTYNNEVQLNNIIKQIEYYDPYHKDLHLQLILKVCKSLVLVNTNDLQSGRKGLNEVWEILSKRNQLFISDIYLLSAIIFYFPIDTMNSIVKFLIRNIETYTELDTIKRIELNIYINYSLILIKNKLYLDAHTYIEKSIFLSKKSKDYLRLGICYVRKGLILSKLDEKGEVWITKGLNLLDVIEEFNVKKSLLEEITTHY